MGVWFGGDAQPSIPAGIKGITAEYCAVQLCRLAEAPRRRILPASLQARSIVGIALLLHMSWFLKRVGLLPRAGLSDPPLAGSTASVPGELPGITSASPSLSATDDANPAESNCQQMALHRNVDLIGTVAHGGVETYSKNFTESLNSDGIIIKRRMPHSSQENGQSECSIRSLREISRQQLERVIRLTSDLHADVHYLIIERIDRCQPKYKMVKIQWATFSRTKKKFNMEKYHYP